MFHVSDTIIWGLYSTYSATIWDNRPFTLTVWSESLVLATVVPEKIMPLLWPLPPTGNARRLLCNGQTAPVSGALGGALAPLWLPLPLLETKDCCEMTKHSHIQGRGANPAMAPIGEKGTGLSPQSGPQVAPPDLDRASDIHTDPHRVFALRRTERISSGTKFGLRLPIPGPSVFALPLKENIFRVPSWGYTYLPLYSLVRHPPTDGKHFRSSKLGLRLPRTEQN